MAQDQQLLLVFGHHGNTRDYLQEGWSVEEWHAWAVGDTSRLILPMPGDGRTYVLRLTVAPMVHPETHPIQRLDVEANGQRLVSFNIGRHSTLEIPLPPALTASAQPVTFVFHHRDAIRPSDVKDSGDNRWLALAFQTGGIFQLELDRPQPKRDAALVSAESAGSVTMVVCGFQLARELVAIVERLPTLHRHLDVHYVDPVGPLDRVIANLPKDLLASTMIYWEQSGSGDPQTKSDLRQSLRPDCDVRTFPTLFMKALWPYLGEDPRRKPDPPLYRPGRYTFGDTVAARLTDLNVPDDTLFAAYMDLTEREMPDLDAYLASDLAAWQALDASSDVKMSDYLVQSFRSSRIFTAPWVIGADVVHAIARYLLNTAPMCDLADPQTVARELAALMRGYTGWPEELPVHPTVARHFGLTWWSPDMLYRFFGTHVTFRDYILNYIRWTPWLP